jgi:hypothetical protein
MKSLRILIILVSALLQSLIKAGNLNNCGSSELKAKQPSVASECNQDTSSYTQTCCFLVIETAGITQSLCQFLPTADIIGKDLITYYNSKNPNMNNLISITKINCGVLPSSAPIVPTTPIVVPSTNTTSDDFKDVIDNFIIPATIDPVSGNKTVDNYTIISQPVNFIASNGTVVTYYSDCGRKSPKSVLDCHNYPTQFSTSTCCYMEIYPDGQSTESPARLCKALPISYVSYYDKSYMMSLLNKAEQNRVKDFDCGEVKIYNSSSYIGISFLLILILGLLF